MQLEPSLQMLNPDSFVHLVLKLMMESTLGMAELEASSTGVASGESLVGDRMRMNAATRG